jgi:hypothetical protein
VGHLRRHGFAVRSAYQEDLSAVRAQHGVPSDLRGCDTAVITEWVVEGHLPGDLILLVLRAGPASPASPCLACRPVRLAWRGQEVALGVIKRSRFDQNGGRTRLRRTLTIFDIDSVLGR